MRLTGVLCMPQHVKKLRAASWQRWRRRKIEDDGLAKKLEDSGIQVIDAVEFVKKDSPIFRDLDAIPDPEPIFPSPQPKNHTHPNWNPLRCKLFTDSTFPMEGTAQAQAFTNSVQIKHGLPDSILDNLTQFTKLDKQDYLVQNAIQHAFLWDAYLKKPYRLRDLDIPHHGFPLKYGIPPERSNELLMRDLLRLCGTYNTNEYHRRAVIGPSPIRVHMERNSVPVQFRLTPMITLLSKDHLAPICERISETKAFSVPDLKPFDPVVNFENENIYEPTDFSPVKENSSFPLINMACFSHTIPGSFTHIHPRWNADRFSGCTILYGFATALLTARRKFGKGLVVLPSPITTQIVHYTGKEFQFGIFQLNTLNFNDDEKDGVKNIAWITDRMRLFDVCEYDYEIGRARFEGYNPEIFKYLLGLYTAGCKSFEGINL